MDATKYGFERRHRGGKQYFNFFSILALLFSIVGLIGWMLPLEGSETVLRGGISPLLGIMFGVMTVISGVAVALNYWSGRTFERRGHSRQAI